MSEAAEKIIDIINNLALPTQKVAEKLTLVHPTLQQDFMRLCLSYIQKQSEKDISRTDLRNEATVKIAKKIASAIEYGDFFVPRI